MRKFVLAALTILLVFGVVTSARATTAAEAQTESEFLARTNADRAANGVRQLRIAGDLVDIARRHSAEMAASNSIYHSSNLGGTVKNWQKIGENVGRGSNVNVVQDAFMSSTTHRANIVDGAFTESGIGVVWKDTTLYVTVVFRKPATTSSAPAPAPSSSTPQPAPVRVASAAPRPAPRPPAPASAPAPVPVAPVVEPMLLVAPETIAASMATGPQGPSPYLSSAERAARQPPVAESFDGIRAEPLVRLLAVALVLALAALLYERRSQLTTQITFRRPESLVVRRVRQA